MELESSEPLLAVCDTPTPTPHSTPMETFSSPGKSVQERYGAAERVTQPSRSTHMYQKQLLRHLSWGGGSVVSALSSVGHWHCCPSPALAPRAPQATPFPVPSPWGSAQLPLV